MRDEICLGEELGHLVVVRGGRCCQHRRDHFDQRLRAGDATDRKPIPASSKQEVLPSATVRFAKADANEVPDMQRHVLPLMGRLGCNGRSCHGSFQGAGGFRLSCSGMTLMLITKR